MEVCMSYCTSCVICNTCDWVLNMVLGNCAFCEIHPNCNKWKRHTIIWNCPDYVELGDEERAKEILDQ